MISIKFYILQNSLKKLDVHGDRRYLQGKTSFFFTITLNINNREKLDVPHVDLKEFKHMVILYYVKDADETVIYNETIKKDEKMPIIKDLTQKNESKTKQAE